MGNFVVIEKEGSNMTTRVPIVSTENVIEFHGSSITRYSGKTINTIVDQYPEEKERVYITQRPGISLQTDASTYVILYYTDTGTNFALNDVVTGGTSGATGTVTFVDTQGANSIMVLTISTGTFVAAETLTSTPTGGQGTVNANGAIFPTTGRGVYFWSANQKRYIASTRGIYQSDYNTPCRITSATGTPLILTASKTEKVHFIEWTNSAGNQYLFILDTAGNKMYYIDSGADTIVHECTGSGTTTSGDAFNFTNFPPNQTPTLTLIHGVEILDEFMFVGTTDGRIWNNSAVGDLLDWSSALGFITAEREPDGLLFITKSRDHILGFGQKTIELFYDAANAAPGSPLNRRTDLFYNTGIVNGESAWRDGDDIWFLGTSPHGDFNYYRLGSDFVLVSESPPSLNSYFRNSSVYTADRFKISGFATGKHTYSIMTAFSSTNVPKISFTYDSYSGMWSEWETKLRGHDYFPIIGVTVRTQEELINTEAIMSNGDIFTVRDDLIPLDVDDTSGYFLEDYEAQSGADSYDVNTGEITVYQIDMYSKITNLDFDTLKTKFWHEMCYFGTITANDYHLDVKWSKDDGRTWGVTRSLSTYNRQHTTRLGGFQRIDIQAHFKGGEQLRLEGLHMEMSIGTYHKDLIYV